MKKDQYHESKELEDLLRTSKKIYINAVISTVNAIVLIIALNIQLIQVLCDRYNNAGESETELYNTCFDMSSGYQQSCTSN